MAEFCTDAQPSQLVLKGETNDSDTNQVNALIWSAHDWMVPCCRKESINGIYLLSSVLSPPLSPSLCVRVDVKSVYPAYLRLRWYSRLASVWKVSGFMLVSKCIWAGRWWKGCRCGNAQRCWRTGVTVSEDKLQSEFKRFVVPQHFGFGRRLLYVKKIMFMQCLDLR